MDRNTAVKMAWQASKEINRRMADAVLKIKAEHEQSPQALSWR
jgi:hypothetical protein